MFHKKVFVSLYLAALCCVPANFAVAQEVRATIGGKVTDPQGAIVPGATVVVVSEETNVQNQTKTNEQGNWSVGFLLPGRYQFAVTSSGFKTTERKIELQAADNKTFDVQLEVGTSSQSVEDRKSVV